MCSKKCSNSVHFKTLQDLRYPVLLDQLIKMQKTFFFFGRDVKTSLLYNGSHIFL